MRESKSSFNWLVNEHYGTFTYEGGRKSFEGIYHTPMCLTCFHKESSVETKDIAGDVVFENRRTPCLPNLVYTRAKDFF